MLMSRSRDRFSRQLILVVIAGLLLLTSTSLLAQNIVSGEVTGTVVDATGAVMPNVTVALKSSDTGYNQTANTGSTGFFRFPLLKPGTYVLTATPQGFATITKTVAVAVGVVNDVKLQVNVAGKTEVIDVTGETPLLQTENANVTASFDTKLLESVPNSGNDMTTFAFSAPGVTLSRGAGYGNFTAYGLPGTSNSYTLNGGDVNDPFNGLNNSGASNNMLGTNELSEMTIVTNGYTGQYGRGAGANVNFATKSGSNAFHGNAQWQWNGDVMNANDWFLNNENTPRQFSNSNAWAGSIGGPIVKNKLFFFYDNEGLRYVLPSGGLHYLPSAQYQAATLANITSTQPGQLAFYQNYFNLFNTSQGAARATPVDANDDIGLGCGDIYTYDSAYTTVTGSNFPALFPVVGGVPQVACASKFAGGGNSKNTERLMSVRVDWVANSKDNVYFRWWEDRGTQATYTDPFQPIFNATSNQPQDTGQANWTHVFNPNIVNQLILGGSYYSAIFSASNLSGARAAFPTTLFLTDSLISPMGGEDYAWPQGRRVAQAQLVDDFSWTRGDHAFKFGANIRKNWITDKTPFRNTTGELEVGMTSLYEGLVGSGDDGGGDILVQRYIDHNAAYFSYISMGFYAQDEWRASSKLKLTMAVRFDRNTNETCKYECISRFAGDFTPNAVNVPYNQSIQTGLSSAFPRIEPIVISPRVGIAYQIRPNTVLRGGAGIFSDLYPGQLAEPFASNPPLTTSFNVAVPGAPVAYGAPGDLSSIGQASYNALNSGFNSGATYAQIAAQLATLGVPFSRPTLTAAPNNFLNPKYVQWNLAIEQAFGRKTSLTVNYVGNHGYDEVLRNPTVNSYCVAAYCPIVNLPTSRPDGRFGQIIQYTNNGYSNYNGLVTTLHSQIGFGFQLNANYTWSHSLDTVSNGGLQPYNALGNGGSFLFQIMPGAVPGLNYGNSDYDIRQTFSLNYVWTIPYKSSSKGMEAVLGGWSLSGTVYALSGEPFSVYSSSPTKYIGNGTNAVVMASYTGGGEKSCNNPSQDGSAYCLAASQFVLPTAGATLNTWGNTPRNYFRGPKYFNSDLSLLKRFKITEGGMAFSLGMNFYNVFNHPNFANPSGDLTGANGPFGQITSTATSSSSPYGNFQGAAVSGRLMQTVLKFEF